MKGRQTPSEDGFPQVGYYSFVPLDYLHGSSQKGLKLYSVLRNHTHGNLLPVLRLETAR